jgi:hypothetical protein
VETKVDRDSTLDLAKQLYAAVISQDVQGFRADSTVRGAMASVTIKASISFYQEFNKQCPPRRPSLRSV